MACKVLTVRGKVDLFRELRDVYFKPFLNLVQHPSVRLVWDERDSETLCTEPTRTSHLTSTTLAASTNILTRPTQTLLIKTAIRFHRSAQFSRHNLVQRCDQLSLSFLNNSLTLQHQLSSLVWNCWLLRVKLWELYSSGTTIYIFTVFQCCDAADSGTGGTYGI